MSDLTITTALPVNRTSGASFLSACWTLYTLTLRQHLHGKRWLVMLALFLLPTLLAVLVRSTTSDVPQRALEFMLVMLFTPQALLPLLALLYASGVMQDEQEEQTITYLLIRPLPKFWIYTVKLFAAMTTTAALVAVSLAFTYTAIYFRSAVPASEVLDRWFHAAMIQGLAVITYCSVFGLFSLLTRRILVVGVLYTAVVEGLFANLPFGIRLATVVYYMRVIVYRTMSFEFTNQRGQDRDIAARIWQFDAAADPQLVEHPQLSTCILVLLSVIVVSTAIAGYLVSQREFHVKTPEKS
jgi:ABC-2 type transport system permease protein